MVDPGEDVKALKEAFDRFTLSTRTLEDAYRRLEARARELGLELAAKNQELALTIDYLNYILESMSDGVIAIDTGGVITTFNRAASEVLGFTAAEAVGREFHELLGREFSAAPAALSGRLRAKSGRAVPVAERDEPIADRNNVCIGHVKVFQDLTEIEALREQVRQNERLAAIGEMAATVAHEIRNPLGGIRGFAALLARDIPAGDPRARLVEKILVGAASLNRVVDELLEYTRPVEIRLRAVDCAELVSAALAYLDLDGRPVAIHNNVAPGLIVRADPDKMRQVLLNVLLNAVQSIEGSGSVWIDAAMDADWAALCIRDSGCGMDAGHIGKIFSPFFTTKEKGTGLGLAVAAKIVEGHLGTIKAESSPGKGTAIHIRLPRMA